MRFLDWLRILPCAACGRTGPCGVYLVTAGEAIALCQACNGLGEAEAAQDEGEELSRTDEALVAHGPHDSTSLFAVANHS